MDIYNTNLDLINFKITLLKKQHNLYKFNVIYKPTNEEFFIFFRANKNNILKIELQNYYINKNNTIISNITHRKYSNSIQDIMVNKFLLTNVFSFLITL